MPPEAIPFVQLNRIVVFAVGLLIGGLAIHVSTRYFLDGGSYGDAVLTALVGAVAWALLQPVPLLGPGLALVAWVAVIRYRYSGGWIDSAVAGLAAWAVAVVVLAALGLVGIGSFSAVGVPGA